LGPAIAQNTSDKRTASGPATPSGGETGEARKIVADQIMIDIDGTVHKMGTIIYSSSSDGRLTHVERPESDDLVKVYIFKRISPSYAVQLKKVGMNVHPGQAYLYTEARPIPKLQYIRDVDVSLSNEELAKLFGVKMQEPTEKR
jgi:hypothetical protein